MLDYELFGDSLGRFHQTSVALHALNTVLVFGLLLRTTGRLLRSGLVAALFALHPLHVESVVWLTERKGLLSSCFALSALHAYVGYARRPSGVRMAGVAACFALGLASKPMVVTLPFVALLLDVWPLRRIDLERAAQAAGPLQSLRASGVARLAGEKWPLFALAAGSVAITLSVQQVAILGLETLPPVARAASVGTAYWKYLALTLWPVGLTPIHLHPGPALALGQGLAGLLGIGLVSLALLARLRSRPEWVVGWFWFVGMLVPVTGAVQVGAAIVAERYTYLPLIGLFVAGVWAAADAVAGHRRRQQGAGALALAVVVACGAASQRRVPDWSDTVTLFQRAIEVDPDNALAHTVLGLGYARARDDDRAIEHYHRAAQLRPNHHALLQRIGLRLARKGDFERARRAFELELEIAPDYSPARNELALLWLREGDREHALEEFDKLLRLDPNYPVAHENIGYLLLLGERGVGAGGESVVRAREHLERAVELAPRRASARRLLAESLRRAGDIEAAEFQIEQARALEAEAVPPVVPEPSLGGKLREGES